MTPVTLDISKLMTFIQGFYFPWNIDSTLAGITYAYVEHVLIGIFKFCDKTIIPFQCEYQTIFNLVERILTIEYVIFAKVFGC